ncbi:unannotated protein [freshwater metagenome]|uniref:Unannotated protein n=1 Tax=freshwater metagenome TaxID=449393 RepID=A0A6J6T455_9ZZZZ|nr:glycosyltransferase [Actinomycetota bacterium]
MTPRVCANMIVKNESRIIERCCFALSKVIDCYVICDTGSTDDTVDRIRAVFGSSGIPGEVVHAEFRNFEQARNEALDAARSSRLDFDYILMCDADMELTEVSPSWRDELTEPGHAILQRTPGGLEYRNIRLVRRDQPARYRGFTHEYLDIPGAASPIVHGLLYLDHQEGSNRIEKFERDIRLLREALDVYPDDARSAFYLANSYFDIGRHVEAQHWYRKRLTLQGYGQEEYFSRYRIALGYQQLGSEPRFFHEMLLTHNDYPHRAEPLHALALHAQRANRHQLALSLARIGLLVPQPEDALFVETDVYTWRLADIAAVALYWLSKPDEALTINEQLLALVPEDQRARIEANAGFCRVALGA